MSLYRIVYHSKAALSMKDSEIFSIVSKAQVNNKNLGITGLLLYIEDSFFQLLEGDEQTVKELYYKIAQDERHENVRPVLQGKIDSRDFSSWNMGLKIFTTQDIQDLKEINKNQEFDLLADLSEKQDLAIELMRYFYKNGDIDFNKFWSSNNDIDIIK